MMIEKIIAGNEKAMDFEPQMVDYPNNIGLPIPLPPNHYEIAISGKQNEKREAIPQIMKLFESNGVKVVSLSFSNDQSVDQFVMNAICDLSSAKCSQDELLIRVNKSKFVKIAEMSSLEGRIFSRFSFPLTFFGEIRALAIDSDRFLRLLDDFTRELGPKARETIFENGRREGKEIIEALRDKLGERWSKDRPMLVENVRNLLQSAGWGKLLFHNEGAEIYKASIRDPPSDANSKAIMNNYFLHGMVAGVLESFLKEGTELSMIREGYEEDKKTLLLYYMDRALIKELASEDDNLESEKVAITPREEIKLPEQTPVLVAPESIKPRHRSNRSRSAQEALAAAEVNQIIKSIDQIRQIEEENAKEREAITPDEGEQPIDLKPIQGEVVGYGVQIVPPEQQTRKPSSIEKKRNYPSSSDNKSEYTTAETVQF